MADIGAIIFDFGGVLRAGSPAGDQAASPYALLEREFGLEAGSLFRAVYLENSTWLDLRVGKGSEDAWRESVSAALEAAVGVAKASELFARLEEMKPPAEQGRRNAEFNPGMVELVEELRENYRVGILSNAAPGLEEELAENYGIAHLFHDIVNSATVGVAKPDPRIFRIAAERIGVPIESCFFTDDLIHNVEAARAEGMTAHLFEGVEGLREALELAGVRA